MGNLKQEANEYEPETYKNISELSSISVDVDVLTETKKDRDGNEYTTKYFLQDGEKVRVPISVLSALKEILEEKTNLKHFKVKRKGTTKEDTRYTVIPLD